MDNVREIVYGFDRVILWHDEAKAIKITFTESRIKKETKSKQCGQAWWNKNINAWFDDKSSPVWKVLVYTKKY